MGPVSIAGDGPGVAPDVDDGAGGSVVRRYWRPADRSSGENSGAR